MHCNVNWRAQVRNFRSHSVVLRNVVLQKHISVGDKVAICYGCWWFTVACLKINLFQNDKRSSTIACICKKDDDKPYIWTFFLSFSSINDASPGNISNEWVSDSCSVFSATLISYFIVDITKNHKFALHCILTRARSQFSKSFSCFEKSCPAKAYKRRRRSFPFRKRSMPGFCNT